jgi:hypothetical protein
MLYLHRGKARMNSNQNDVLAILSEQCRHQVRLARKRMTWWIPWIFVLGNPFAATSLVTASKRERTWRTATTVACSPVRRFLKIKRYADALVARTCSIPALSIPALAQIPAKV